MFSDKSFQSRIEEANKGFKSKLLQGKGINFHLLCYGY